MLRLHLLRTPKKCEKIEYWAISIQLIDSWREKLVRRNLETVFFVFQGLCHEYVTSVVVRCSALILFLVLTDAKDFAFFLLLKSRKWWNNILKSKSGRLCLSYAMNLLTCFILEFIYENIFLFRLKLAIKGNNHQSGVIPIL